MRLLLDAGAFIALEREDKVVTAIVKGQVRAGIPPITHGGVVGQVWRGGAKQVRIANALALCKIVPLDADLGRRAGVLLRLARKSDVVDAALMVLAADGDAIITSDPRDLVALAAASGAHVELIEA